MSLKEEVFYASSRYFSPRTTAGYSDPLLVAIRTHFREDVLKLHKILPFNL